MVTRGRRLFAPGGSLLNPKFFRNGIVMLVLVVGTAALLFTWITSTTPTDHTSAIPQFLADVQAGKVTKVIQEGDDPDRRAQRRPADLHGHRPERR